MEFDRNLGFNWIRVTSARKMFVSWQPSPKDVKLAIDDIYRQHGNFHVTAHVRWVHGHASS